MKPTTLADLIAQRDALDRQIAEASKESKAAAIAEIRSLMVEHGLTAVDLEVKAAPSRPGKRSAPSGKVAAKYRNTETGETWSGRGLKPKWLAAALAAGKVIGDFVV
jgi:DNA-binding protein H-NS